MSNVERFNRVVAANGQTVTYHRESGGIDCPCLSPEGFRNLPWHRDHPPGTANASLAGPPWNGINPPLCNEEGKQNLTVIDTQVKGFVQPIFMRSDYMLQRFGELQENDHVGMFPLSYGGTELNFDAWSQSGDEFVMHNGNRYLVVAAELIPDPAGGGMHHWEVQLRLMKTERANAA